MVRKASTIKLQGGEYAQVAQRVKLFREDCPNGKIITKRLQVNEGNVQDEVTYRTYVWKDRKNYISNDLLSCDSSAEATLVVKNNKDKEKVETISVGRALAMLGYLASGEIASSEEMEEFYKEKDQKAIEEAVAYKEKVIDDLQAAKDIDELRLIYSQSRLAADSDIINVKNEMKEKLSKAPFQEPPKKEKPKDKPKAKKEKVKADDQAPRK